jgi:hypothetical protein
LADGSYDGYGSGFAGVYARPDGVIYLHGNAANPENVIIIPVANYCLGATDGLAGYPIFVNNVTLQGSSNSSHYGILAAYASSVFVLGYNPGFLILGTVRFTGSFKRLIWSDYAASVEVYGTLRLSLSASVTSIGYASERAMLVIGVDALFMDVAQTFTDFFKLDRLAYGYFNTIAETGTFTGRKYDVTSNSLLHQTSTVPGSVAGITATGGQVI